MYAFLFAGDRAPWSGVEGGPSLGKQTRAATRCNIAGTNKYSPGTFVTVTGGVTEVIFVDKEEQVSTVVACLGWTAFVARSLTDGESQEVAC